MKLQRAIPLATLAISLFCGHESFTASFTSLGFEDACGVSDDGVFAGGSRWSADDQAVRWTAGGGALGLGFLSGASYSSAFAMSPDGQMLVGVSGERAFRWSAASGMSDLGSLPGKTYHVAWAVSGDGSIVVGSGDVDGDEEHVEPFRWTPSGGMVSLGFLPGTSRAEALAISRDGHVIVGYSGNDDVQAFRRGPDGIMSSLGFLPGYIESIARGVSGDGSVIVGDCRDVSGNSQAFRWTEFGGMRGLGVIAGYDESNAQAVSGDGAIVVGEASLFDSQTGEFKSRAFIWDAVHGMRELQAVLVNQFGLNLSGWILNSATAVSADGTAIVGTGTNPQGEDAAWMARSAATEPALSITRSSTSVVISWPNAFSNFVLQSRNSLAPSYLWLPATNTPVLGANEWVVTNSLLGGDTFFRLKSQ